MRRTRLAQAIQEFQDQNCPSDLRFAKTIGMKLPALRSIKSGGVPTVKEAKLLIPDVFGGNIELSEVIELASMKPDKARSHWEQTAFSLKQLAEMVVSDGKRQRSVSAKAVVTAAEKLIRAVEKL